MKSINMRLLNTIIRKAGTCRIMAILLILVLLTVGCSGSKGGQGTDTAGTGESTSVLDRSADIAIEKADNNDSDALLLDDGLDQEAANAAAAAEAGDLNKESEWVTFLLICNEGMNNTGSNVGNTLMAVSMNSDTGKIRLMMITWDTFVKYEGYDVPQVIDMAYRNGGPEEAIKIVDNNFDLHIDRFMSLNFLNLATLIDDYGGVTVDITRAERNALNGMVASKRRDLQSRAGDNIITQHALEMMETEYHLNEFGPDTKLNGLQAVGYGWLQYDSVYNCCEREIAVVSGLFKKISEDIKEEAVFYTDKTGAPDITDSHRAINLDNITEDDRAFLMKELSPIIHTSYNNLTTEEFMDMSIALARAAYIASREGVDIFDNIDHSVFPLEAKEPYDLVAGIEGHLIDYEKNSSQMKNFLYAENIQ